jgi:hypothetical protein
VLCPDAYARPGPLSAYVPGPQPDERPGPSATRPDVQVQPARTLRGHARQQSHVMVVVATGEQPERNRLVREEPVEAELVLALRGLEPLLGAELIAQLSARSPEFRGIWATGEVVMRAAGRKRLRHPAAGLLTLDFETLHVPAAPGETGLVVRVFSAQEGSREAGVPARLAAR